MLILIVCSKGNESTGQLLIALHCIRIVLRFFRERLTVTAQFLNVTTGRLVSEIELNWFFTDSTRTAPTTTAAIASKVWYPSIIPELMSEPKDFAFGFGVTLRPKDCTIKSTIRATSSGVI